MLPEASVICFQAEAEEGGDTGTVRNSAGLPDRGEEHGPSHPALRSVAGASNLGSQVVGSERVSLLGHGRRQGRAEMDLE